MWADSKTFTFNTAAGLQALGISEPSASSATYLTSAISISPVTISSAKNDASNPAGVFKNSGGTAIDLRLYKYGKNGSKGSSITISVSGNYKLTGISGLWNSGSVSASTGSLSSGSWSPAANTTTTSVEIYSTATSTVSGCTVIIVSYESTGGGSQEPTVSADNVELESEAYNDESIALTYSDLGDNDVTNVTATLYDDEECNTEFSGGWLNDIKYDNTNWSYITFDASEYTGTTADRVAYMKIVATIGSTTATKVISITQAKVVVDYATLPFTFNNKGRADIATTSGITHEGLDTDYGDSNSKLKFKTAGTWVIIKINSDPGKLTYVIKGNSMSGTYAFDVEQSDDGVTYSNLTTHTSISGNNESKEFSLKKTTRYVRFIYTTKDGGNVGLGNIGITAYEAPTVCEAPTFSPAAGEYEGTQNVTITCETDDATIYYTTDGTTPNTSSSVYSSAITVSENKTIKAYAVKSGLTDSEVAEAAYTIVDVPDVTLNLLDEGWGFPSGSEAKVVDETSYTNGDYTIKVAGTSGNGFKLNSGYFILGKEGAYIELPEFATPIDYIVIEGNDAGSASVTWNIFQGDNAVSTPATGCEKSAYKFNIDNPEENAVYRVKVTGNANLQIKTIKIFYGVAPAVKKPVITGNAAFVGSQDVTISCATDGATIYYTTDATKKDNPSTETWSAYGTKVTLEESCTLYAAATDGEHWSSVASKEFTATPLYTSIEALQGVATTTETTVFVQMTNWLVTAVSGNNAYVTDGTGNGMILYKYGHGFVANDKLNKAQLETTLQFYTDGGCAELKNLTTANFAGEGELVHDAAITPIDKTASEFAALTVASQGALFKVTNLTYDASEGKFMNGTDEVAYYNKFSIDESGLIDGHTYNVIGVAVYHKAGDVVQLCPRTAADLQDNTAYVQISFDANTTETYGGTLPTTITTHVSGTDYTVPVACLTRTDGYYQLGWNTDKDATTALSTLENVTTNQTLYAIWKETANCTISFYSKGALYTTKVKAQNAEYDFNDVVAPSVQGWTFYGWSADEIATEEASATKLTSVTPTSSTMSLYAIFSRKIDGTPYTQYEKVTSAPSDWSGDYLIVYEGDNTHASVALNGALETLEANFNGVSVTIKEGVIASSTAVENAIFTIEAMTGGYSIQAHNENGDYIYASTYNNTLNVSSDPQANSLAITDGAAVISNTFSGGTVTMKYNYATNTERFRYYKSGQQAVQLYKAKEVTPQVDVYSTEPVIRYTISFVLASGESGTFNDISVAKGGNATLPATTPTKSHNTFLKWSDGETEYAASATITNVQDDIELHATWDPETPATVTFDLNGASGSIAAKENLYGGDPYQLPAAPEYDADHAFVGWSDGVNVYAAGAQMTMTTPAAAVEYVAQWNDVVIDQVVILAMYAGNWYAVKNTGTNHAVDALQVDYHYGNIYNDFTSEQKAAITWTRKTVGNQMSFKNGDYYLQGKTNDDNDLELGTDECFWNYDGNANPVTYRTHSNHSILYRGEFGTFKNYKNSNASSDGITGAYSALPIVTTAKFNTIYTRPGAVQGQLGTICVPNGGRMVGASAFEIAYMDYDLSGNPYKIYFDEVEELVAGRPYVFLTEDENPVVKVYYTDATGAGAGNYHGLYGTFDEINTLDQGNYIIYNNMYYKVTSDNVIIDPNRAYIKLSEVPGYEESLNNAPGRRRISIGNGSNPMPTDVESVEIENAPRKVMIDGHIYIIRGEKRYDVRGQLVK